MSPQFSFYKASLEALHIPPPLFLDIFSETGIVFSLHDLVLLRSMGIFFCTKKK